jgi:catechol 2,3-dioxygenase-like lactoylglutathione lyase family enzyme
MSYVALATDAFASMVHFYGRRLRFPVVAEWDRATGRGCRFDLGGGLRLELLDNAREKRGAKLLWSNERTHIVVEVADIESVWRNLALDVPMPQQTSWGARIFQLRDPDGTAVTYLEWTQDHGGSKC